MAIPSLRLNPAPALLLVSLLFAPGSAQAQECPAILWQDEFNGSALDVSKWSYQLGDGCSIGVCGWGNNEEETYQEQNVAVSGGTLKITARKERVRNKKYTSGRIRTIDKGDFVYGRFEARIKMTRGQGIWPAFWMMPTDEVYGYWPQSGEIDIMENVGHEPRTVHGTIHFGDPSPNNRMSGASYALLDSEGSFADGFHEFAVEKEPGAIRWYVDDILYATKTTADTDPYRWPFDERFHFLLNVAVGGNWPGSPDATTVFPQTLEVDYVRVYDRALPQLTGARIVPNHAAGVVYSVGNGYPGSTFVWSVPAGATIVGGQGTSAITVDWGDTGGTVAVNASSGCGSELLAMAVEVEPAFSYAFTFENFDDPANVTLSPSSTGTLVEVDNPDPSSELNSSPRSGAYTRDASVQYDVLFYDVSVIGDASAYKSGTSRFVIDLYTDAPVGTEIVLQLEDNGLTTPGNYPTGRNSRYRTYTTTQHAWERLTFAYLDTPDAGTADSDIDQIALLFAPNTLTGRVYTFDHFDSYSSGPPLTAPAAPSSLGATAASSTEIDLTWSDNADNEAGFKIERSIEGGPFAEIHATGANVTGYSDGGLNPSTLYAYRVLAFNAAGPSGYSTTASATTGSGGPATTMHVASITTGTISVGKGAKHGTATVLILDDQGSPVNGASVTGTFSGAFNEIHSGATGADGLVTLSTTASKKGGVSITFCVDNVARASLSYDSSANVQSCSGGAGKRPEGPEGPGAGFALAANYPNPFNGHTTLSFTLPEPAPVLLTVHDALGREVRRLVEGLRPAGLHTIPFDAGTLPNGVYLYRLSSGAMSTYRTMMLAR